MNGSVIIVTAKTIEEVRDVVNTDPYWVGDVVRTNYCQIWKSLLLTRVHSGTKRSLLLAPSYFPVYRDGSSRFSVVYLAIEFRGGHLNQFRFLHSRAYSSTDDYENDWPRW